MDCGIVLSKFILLVISLIFCAAGAALSYVGAYVISSYKNFDDFRVDNYTLVPTVIIAVAGIMIIIGIIGCCVTLRESKVGLCFFLLIILLIFAAEVTALGFGFINRGKVNGELDKSMGAVFVKYNGQNSETQAVDYLQSHLECCGVENYTDWLSWPWFSSHNNSVPLSCCKRNSTCTGQFRHLEMLNTNGCKSELEQLLQSVLTFALLVVLGFAIIQLLGIISICMIVCRSSRNDYQPLDSQNVW